MYISGGTGTQKLHTLGILGHFGTQIRLRPAPCADSWTQPSVHFVPLINGIKKTSRSIRGNYSGLSHGCNLEPRATGERKTIQNRISKQFQGM
jgi:hypothetical protein